MEFTGFKIQFVSKMIQVKYLIVNWLNWSCYANISQFNSALRFWFVARFEAAVALWRDNLIPVKKQTAQPKISIHTMYRMHGYCYKIVTAQFLSRLAWSLYIASWASGCHFGHANPQKTPFRANFL